jgi:hypothetical protein
MESSCPHCGNLLKVRPEYRGSRLRCPRCNQLFRVEDEPVAEFEELPIVPDYPEDDIPLLPLAPVEEEEEVLVLAVVENPAVELPYFEIAQEEPVTLEVVPPPLPEPKPKPPPLPDRPPTPKPDFIEVWQPISWRRHRIFRLFLHPEEPLAVFVAIPPGPKEVAAQKRLEERLKRIDSTSFDDLKNDHRLNFTILLDEILEASLHPCGRWYRFRQRSPRGSYCLTLRHRREGKLRLEIRDREAIQKLREFLPGSLGKRLHVR